MKRSWILGSWGLVALATIVAVFATLNRSTPVRAQTQLFGPKEAEVTIEDGDWKTVHLTASVFKWQFRPDQEPVEVWGYNEQIPGPTLRFRPGDKVRFYVRNDMEQPTSVHWHGLVVPNSMDGVGLLTQPTIKTGETFVYEFEIPNTPGSFMYHSHVNDLAQIGMGLVGAFIVDPRDGGDGKYDQDHIMFMNTIKGHFLINGKEFPSLPDAYLVKKGDLIRVRLINVGPNDIHPMHFHGHFTKEIARDGTDIDTDSKESRVENTVLVAPGQTVDVEVRMNAPGKGYWLFHCHIISHVMGPDGLSENIALANGGMVIPVLYTDSEDFDQVLPALTNAIEAIKPENGGTLQPADGPAMSASEMDAMGQ